MVIDRSFLPTYEYPSAFRKQLRNFEQKTKNCVTPEKMRHTVESIQQQMGVLTAIAHEKQGVRLACRKYLHFSKNYEKPIGQKIEKCVSILKGKEQELCKLEMHVAKQAIDRFNPAVAKDCEKLTLEILKVREEINFHFCYGSATSQLKKAGFWKRLFGIRYEEFVPEQSRKWIKVKTKTIFNQIQSFQEDPLTKGEWLDVCKHIEDNKYEWFRNIHEQKLTHLYIKHHSEKGTHRTVRVDADGKIYLILKICLGNGVSKKARLTLDYTANTLCANAIAKIENETRKCVENEIQITNQLKGKSHVIQLHKALEYSGSQRDGYSLSKMSMMMDFCNCGDLSNLIKAGLVLTPIQKKQLVTDILIGLQSTHKARIVHRDLKIENIFVNREIQTDGTCIYRGFVGDYGLASHLNDQVKLKIAAGTRYAFAPEVWKLKESHLENRKAVGLPSDYYSLGILFAEMFGMTVEHIPQFKTLKFNQKPQPNDPWYLVWMLTQRDPKSRVNVKEALSLTKKIDWSIDKKHSIQFVPV